MQCNLNMYIHVDACMYVCLCVCLFVCLRVCLFVRTSVCTYVRTYVCSLLGSASITYGLLGSKVIAMFDHLDCFSGRLFTFVAMSRGDTNLGP